MHINIIKDFNRQFEGEYPFLKKLNRDWAITQPLKGIRILHNIPLTKETLIKLESLYLGGAEITVTHLKLPGLQPKQECIDILQAAGADVVIDHNDLSGEYDIALDCCAQIPYLPNVKITKGFVELTQSGTQLYKKMTTSLPIISVDDSKLKCLEGMFGTGEACIRAIKEFFSHDLSNKKFVVFGYGKVGFGIAKYLRQEKAHTTIIEKNAERLSLARENDFQTISIANPEKVLSAINSAYAVITATGQRNLLSDYFDASQVHDAVILINMGADDEYGEKFDDARVFAQKAPINFLLSEPTKMMFLDPVFAVHNVCCEYILNSKIQGYSKLPLELDLPYIKEWSSIYRIDCKEIFHHGNV